MSRLGRKTSPVPTKGVEKFTAPSYRHFLAQAYLPAMPDIVERLRAVGAALDLGCGAGLASLSVTQAFPKARIFGFDAFAPSIEKARKNATQAGFSNRLHFEVYDKVTLPKNKFDLIMLCYAVHHLSDPGKTLRSVARALRAR